MESYTTWQFFFSFYFQKGNHRRCDATRPRAKCLNLEKDFNPYFGSTRIYKVGTKKNISIKNFLPFFGPLSFCGSENESCLSIMRELNDTKTRGEILIR